MNANQQLARRHSGEIATSKTPLKPQQLCLLGELALTAENAKTEIGPELQAEFMREFGDHWQPETIREAFRRWRRQSNFAPSTAEIYEMLLAVCAERKQREQDAENKRHRVEMNAARKWWDEHPEEQAAFTRSCQELEVKLAMPKPVRDVVKGHPDYVCSQEEWEASKARAKAQREFLMKKYDQAIIQAQALADVPKKHPKSLPAEAGIALKRAEKTAGAK